MSPTPYWQPHEQLIENMVSTEWTRRLLVADMEHIFRLAAAKGVQLTVLTYPNLLNKSPTNSTLREISARHPEVMLIDAADALSERFLDPASDLLSWDGAHPNAKGYALLARHVLDTLVVRDALGPDSQDAM